jgi:predicted dehydrogenase
MTRDPLDTVVIGYGHAARSFHVPAIADLVAQGYASGALTVVESREPVDTTGLPLDAIVRSDLPRARKPDGCVVHVCTPPDSHAEIVFAAYRLGYRRFVVEKPMATDPADARRMVDLCESGGAEILVVANWSVSALTEEIRRMIGERCGVPLEELVLTQFKPRLERTAGSDAHRTAFDVEMPHLVALALSLVDGPMELVDSSGSDLEIDGTSYPAMGSATITLRTGDGVPLRLHSDLTAPWRERSVRVEWADGSRLVGFHPCDSSDRYAQLFTWAADGTRQPRRLFHDDTVRRFLRGAYSYFLGVGPKLLSDAHFGSAVTSIISTAAAQARQSDTDHAEGNRGRL